MQLVDEARVLGDQVVAMIAPQAQLGAHIIGLDEGQVLMFGA